MFEGSGGGDGNRTPSRTADNLLSQDYVEIILGLGEGPWKGLVSGTYGPLENFYLGDTPLQNHADGKSNFKDFKITQYVGAENDPPIARVLGGDASNLSVNVHLGQNISVTRTTPNYLRKTADVAGINRLEVRIYFNQLVRQDDEGTHNHTANFKIEHKATNSTVWVTHSVQSITGKTTSGYVKDFLIDVTPLENADYDVKVTKLSPDNGTLEIVEMTWESLQMVTLGRPNFPGLACIHLYGRVSEQFSSLPDFSGIYDTQIIKVPTNYNPETRTYTAGPWDGSFKLAYSNNNAWVLYFLITDPTHGLAHYFKNVSANRAEFYAAARMCDELVPSGIVGQTQPRYTFNDVIDSQKLGMELLMYVAGSFNSTIYDDGNGVIRLKTDMPTTAKQLFTPENVTPDGFNYSFSDINTRYNDVTVQFVNPDLNWEIDERSATVDCSGYIEQNGRIPYSFVAVGCTNTHEAVRRANERVITANTEVTTVNFETTRFGFLAELYDTILVADPISGWSTGGRIKSYANNRIELRDPIYATSSAPCTILIQTYSGLVSLTVTPFVVGACYTFEIVSGTFPTNIPDRTVFTLENNTTIGLAKPFRVVAITEVEGSSERYAISAIEINPSKYSDAATGTVSEPVTYDFTTPGESILPLTMTLENIPPITSSDGTLIYRIHASWVRPFQAYTDHYELDYSEQDSGTWKTDLVYGSETDIQPLKDGKFYTVRLFAVSPVGDRSRVFIEVNSFLVTKKNSILENVTGLTVIQTNQGWQAQWNNPLNIPDLAGVRVKFGNTSQAWQALSNLYLSISRIQNLPWFVAGTTRIQAKYINTSGNESSDAATYDLEILSPSQPDATVTTSFGFSTINFTDPTTTQPLLKIIVRKGEPGSNWTTATLEEFTLGVNQRTFTVNSRATADTLVFFRAVDVAGNVGAATVVTITAGASSVNELLDMIKGDIDETWLSTAFLNDLNTNISTGTLEQIQLLTGVDQNLQVQVNALGQVQNGFDSRVDTIELASSDDRTANALTFQRIIAQRAGAALNSDPWITSLLNWSYSVVSGQLILSPPPVGSSSRNVLRAQEVTALNVPPVPVDFSKVYKVSCKARRNPNVYCGTFYLLVHLADSDGNAINGDGSFWYYPVSNLILTGAVQSFSAKFGAGQARQFPSNARTMQVGVIMGYTDGANNLDAGAWTEAWDIFLEDASVTTALGSEISVINQAVTGLNDTFSQSIQTLSSRINKTVNLRVKSSGLNAAAPGTGIYAEDGTPIANSVRSWNLSVFSTAGVFIGSQTYDVFANGETTNGRSAGHLASDLNTRTVGELVIVTTADEPQSGVTTAMKEALVRCGASYTILNKIQYRGAYVLIGIVGNGEGTGIEKIAGTGGSASDAFIDYGLTLVDGRPIGMGGQPLSAIVQQEALTRATESGHFSAQWALRVSVPSSGVAAIAGIAIAGSSSSTAGARFDMAFRANSFAWLPPEGSGNTPVYPMTFYATQTTLSNGVVVEPGLYLKAAFIEYINADRIDTRGLTIRNLDGSVILGAGTGLNWTLINGRPSNVYDLGYTGDNNATAGATFGVNIGGQITASNVSTYIAAAAIDLAKINRASISSLEAITATIGTLRTATSGARTEIADNIIRVFDNNNVLRLRMGVW